MHSKNPAAVSLGTLGGKSKSKKKVNASRANGKKGGRPKTHNVKIFSSGYTRYDVVCEEHGYHRHSLTMKQAAVAREEHIEFQMKLTSVK